MPRKSILKVMLHSITLSRMTDLTPDVRPDLNDPMDRRVGFLLRKVSAQWVATLHAELTPFDLNPSDATVLIVVADNPGIKPSNIGRMVRIKSTNLAPIVTKLHKLGHINRQRIDGRSHSITLTEQGSVVTTRVREIADAVEQSYMKGIGSREREALIEGLHALLNLEPPKN